MVTKGKIMKSREYKSEKYHSIPFIVLENYLFSLAPWVTKFDDRTLDANNSPFLILRRPLNSSRRWFIRTKQGYLSTHTRYKSVLRVLHLSSRCAYVPTLLIYDWKRRAPINHHPVRRDLRNLSLSLTSFPSLLHHNSSAVHSCQRKKERKSRRESRRCTNSYSCLRPSRSLRIGIVEEDLDSSSLGPEESSFADAVIKKESRHLYTNGRSKKLCKNTV